MKFYKRDPDKALAGMAELTLKQRGAYNSLIDLLYSRDGNVPDDDRRVAKMICCHWREWGTIKLELMALGKVWSEDGLLRARRVLDTIKEASDFAQDQSKRASSGWAKRKYANNYNVPAMPLGNASTATATATATATEEETPSGLARKAARGTRWEATEAVPADWVIAAHECRLAHELPEIDLGLEAETFANFWSSKTGFNATKLDWRRTWINWALKAEGKRNANGKTTAHDKFFNAAASLIREQLSGDGAAIASDGDGAAQPSGRPLLPP